LARSRSSAAETAVDRDLAILLDYPARDVDRAALAAEAAPSLEPLTSWWGSATLGEVERRYVADFDLAGGASLYLTYHRFHDDRLRGRALVTLTRLLREAGWELEHWELPDYLPLLVELATVDSAVGVPLLREYRPELEQIAEALHRTSSPWACALDGVLEHVDAEELVA
jgi:nitrate reductase delta subunit